MRRDRRELALAGALAAATDQLESEYQHRGAIRPPEAVARAICDFVTRDLDGSPILSEEVEALIREGATIGVLIGIRAGKRAA